MRRFGTLRTLSLVLLLLLTCGMAQAQSDDDDDPRAPNEPAVDAPKAAPVDELTAEQNKVSEKFRELEKVLVRMAELTGGADPRRAALLRQAVAQSKERDIDSQFDKLVDLLKQDRLALVVKGQGEVQQDLSKLLELLLSEDRGKRLESEKQRIKEYIKQVNKLIKEQQGLQGETAGDGDAKKIAESQGKLAEKTEQLAKKIGETEGGGQNGKNNPDDKQGDGKQGDGKEKPPGDDKEKPAGNDKNEDKNGDKKPGDPKDKPSDSGKPGDPSKSKDGDQGKPGDPSKSKDKSADGGKSDGGKPNDKDKPKGKDDPDAKDKPEGKDKPEDAGKPDDKNKDDKSPEDKTKDDKGKDDQGKPNKDSKGKSKKGDSKPSKSKPKPADGKPQDQDDDSGDDQDSADEQSDSKEQNPTKKRLEQAEKRMKEAKLKLEEAKRGEANDKQEQALKELAKAKAELEEILRQLREEEIARTLAALETRFRKMLDLQIEVYEGTKRLDNVAESDRDRDEDIEAGRLSRKESQIVSEADKALAILHEEASAVAFPEAVTDMRDDMEQIVVRLAQSKVGTVTQGVEEDVIAALEEMIVALKKAQKDMEDKKNKPGPPQQGGEGQDPPLVDNLAEIKMIRALQMRVNKRTQRYAELSKTEQTEKPELLTALKRLAERQERIHRVTRDIVVGRNK